LIAPLSAKEPGPDSTRVPALSSTVSRSPARSVTLALAGSLRPCGYSAAEGPVDRTTIAWASAEPAENRHPAAISPATTALRVFVSAKDITFSLMRMLQSLEEIEHCIV
jgi:hypothetical protein